MSSEKIWTCKIGGVAGDLPRAADGPMRNAVQDMFKELTGVEATFCFSGWGGKLDGLERSVVENRIPTEAEFDEAKGPVFSPSAEPTFECDRKPTKCDVPPEGWACTRSKGHEGPCAAVPTTEFVVSSIVAELKDRRMWPDDLDEEVEAEIVKRFTDILKGKEPTEGGDDEDA